jgi:hypothetical protein
VGIEGVGRSFEGDREEQILEEDKEVRIPEEDTAHRDSQSYLDTFIISTNYFLQMIIKPLSQFISPGFGVWGTLFNLIRFKSCKLYTKL